MPKVFNESTRNIEHPVRNVRNLKLKKLNTNTNRQKKLKTALKRYNNSWGNSNSRSNSNKLQVTPSSSSESVIYLGSYNLNDEYPLVDLTKSATALNEKKIVLPHPFSNKLLNSNTKNVTNLLKSSTSTSKSSGTLESSKSLNLKKNSKSASCLVIVRDNKSFEKFKTIDLPNQAHLLSRKKKLYIDQITKLNEEDHKNIHSCLMLQEDFNILEDCNPEVIFSKSQSLENLMNAYDVDLNVRFLD